MTSGPRKGRFWSRYDSSTEIKSENNWRKELDLAALVLWYVYLVLCTEDGPQTYEDSSYKNLCPASRATNYTVIIPCARFMTFGASYAGESII